MHTVVFDCLETSSRETINEIIIEVADAIPPQSGLKSLTVKDYGDAFKLDQWPMDQLSNKLHDCEQFVLDNIETRVPMESRGAWLELAGTVVENSECLEQLTVANTMTTAQQGATFLKQLAEAPLNTLKSINFSGG